MPEPDMSIDLQALAPAVLAALAVPLLACDSLERIVYINTAAKNQL